MSDWLEPLPAADRAKALNLASFNLTIRARDYGLPDSPAQGEKVVQRLLGINELQHKLLSQVGHYMDGDMNAYPMDVFSRILYELAAQYNVTDALDAALTSAGRGRLTSE